MAEPTPQIVRLDLDNLDKEVRFNLELKQALSEGRTLLAPLAVEFQGKVQLALVFSEPKPEKLSRLDQLIALSLIANTALLTGIFIIAFGVVYGSL